MVGLELALKFNADLEMPCTFVQRKDPLQMATETPLRMALALGKLNCAKMILAEQYLRDQKESKDTKCEICQCDSCNTVEESTGCKTKSP